MIVVSFSGGRTSAYMAHLLLQNKKREKLSFVFANTGKENEETLQFINECDVRWNLNVVQLEAVIHNEKGVGTTYKVVDFKTASRNGEPFSSMNDKYGIPNKNYPHCTRELKEIPIRKYCRDRFGKGNYQMAIGIRIDERVRLPSPDRVKANGWVYPLADSDNTNWYTTKAIVNDFWKNQGFDLGLFDYEGNCDLCWKKSIKKRKRILKDKPSVGDWWSNEEKKEGGDYVFDRDGYSIEQLKEVALRENAQTTIFELNNDKKACSCFSNTANDGDYGQINPSNFNYNFL